MALKLDDKPGHKHDSEDNGDSWRPPGYDKDNSGYDEKNPESKASKSINEQEAGASVDDGQNTAKNAKEGGFYKPSTSGRKGKNGKTTLKRSGSIKLTRRQKGVVGGVGGLLGFSLLGFFMLLPSTELLKLDFALGRSNSVSSLAAETRTYGFTRSARAFNSGDIGETRVGFLGSKIFRDITSRLETQHGISFDRRSANGRPTRIIIEPPDSSILKGDTPEATRANILKNLDLPDNTRLRQVGVTARGPVFSAFLTGENASTLNRLNKSVVSLDNNSANKTKGPTITALRSRVFRKFWNAPSLFNPINRVASNIDERIRVRADSFRKNRTGKVAQLSAEYQSKVSQARLKLAGSATKVNAALTFTGGLCLLKETSELLPALNYANIALPSMEEAIDKQSVTSQVRYGQGFENDDIRLVTDTFKDEQGRNIWGAKALNASANGTGGDGTDAQPVLNQAFNMRGSSIEQLVDLLVEESGDSALISGVAGAGDTAAGLACSPVGYGIQLVTGVGMLLLGPGGAAVKATSVAQSVAITALITSLLGDAVEGKAEEAARGFCGQDEEGKTEDAEAFGNCLAYGARAASNANASAMGGVELSNTQERIAMMELEKKEIEEFREKSFFARMFDMKEPRSLAVNTIHQANQNQVQNVSNLAPTLIAGSAGLFNGSSGLAGAISSVFTDSAYAQTPTYNWGENFNLVSVPLEILEDPNYDDPFDNQLKAAAIFNNGDEEIEKAKKCFGTEIKKVDGRWQSIPVEEVVPMEEEYADANCDDLSDENWIRTMLFVFDDSIVTSMDCYDGGTSSCQEIGSASGALQNGVATDVGTLDCAGYNRLSNRGQTTARQNYSADIQQQCQELKEKCETGSIESTEKIICEAFKYDGVYYGNGYSDRWSNGSVNNLYGFNTNVGNFGIQAESWKNQRVPEGLNPNNLLECSGLTSVALYDAFGFDGSNIGCSGNYTERNNPSIFRQLNPTEIRPGDFLTLTFSCNSDTSGHVAIAASEVDENGNIIVYETNSWGSPARFTLKNLDRDFPAGRSRYIGQGTD